MTADSKVDFYLSHRELIEDWCSIRPQAAAAVDSALRDAFTELVSECRDDMVLHFGEGGNWRWAQIHFPEPERAGLGVHFELLWHQGHLFTQSHRHTWPIVGLMASEKAPSPPKAQLFEVTRDYVEELHTRLGNRPATEQRWIWNLKVRFEPNAHDVESYGRQCVTELHGAWSACAPLLRAMSTSL